jgi:hypothetical protein
MALMFPHTPKPDTASQAERRLFEEFECQLPDSYQVYHSVAWQQRYRSASVEDGEADFVVVDPKGAILVLEVNSGKRISYDEETGRWESDGRPTADPFAQSLKAKMSLLAKLKERFGADTYYVIGHAVAFPEVEISAGLRLDAPRQIILDARDVKKLRAWTTNCFRYIQADPGLRNWELPHEIREGLKTFLSPSWEFSPPLCAYFKEIDLIIERLTEAQYYLIDALRRHRQVAIGGCAGSGKTLVAVEKAVRLEREGFSVLVLCHNPYLAEYIQALVGEAHVSVLNFITLVRILVEEQGGSDDLLSKLYARKLTPWSQYAEPTPNDLYLATERLSSLGGLFDAVIVDEGQDFIESWWEVAKSCLKDPEAGIFYIFFDDNQAIYPTYGTRLAYPVSGLPYALTQNCRNAGEIFELVRKLHPEAPQVNPLLASKGVVQEWLYASEDELYEALREALLALEEYAPDFNKIVVLSADIGTSSKHALDGLVFDTPTVRDSPATIPLPWRQAVINFLEPYGFRGKLLSSGRSPDQDDLKTVNMFCKQTFSRRKPRMRELSPRKLDEFSVGWIIDIYGKLRLHWDVAGGKRYSRDEIVLSFFNRPGWAESLPSPHLRYRLTTPQELENFSPYVNIRLFDIPTFKGLEADGIILVLHGSMAGFDYQVISRLYVAISRARHLLYIVSPFSLLERIAALDLV